MKLTRRGELFAEFTLGRLVVTALSDGYADVPFSNLLGENSYDRPGAPLADSTIRLQVNAFLISFGRQHLLIDAGSADAWKATVGRLYDALDEARVPRAEIGAVALTHSHVDHVNGLVTPDGAIAFANAASILIHSNEVELLRAEKRLAPALRALSAFQDGDEIWPGVRVVAAYGHEVGHCAFRIESDGERLLVWGDVIHVPDIQFRDPHVTWQYDTDRDAARQSRLRLMKEVADSPIAVAGAHHGFPGIGYVKRDGETFRYSPIVS